jgi:hypothetical protein
VDQDFKLRGRIRLFFATFEVFEGGAGEERGAIEEGKESEFSSETYVARA